MKIEQVKTEKLIPYANNPRINDDAVDKVAASIKEFGFKVPMVITSKNVIVAGHTRYKAAKKLGLESVPCVVADDLTEEQVKAFRIADNKVGEFSTWDVELLKIELKEIENFNFDDLNLDFEDILGEIKDNEERKDYSEKLQEKWELLIECKTEDELKILYETMTKEGRECRILTL